MKYIDIDILFYTEESAQLQELGIKPNQDLHDTKSMRFFEIGAIGPRDEQSVVVCHVSEFYCPWTYETLRGYVSNTSNWKVKL